MSRISEHRRQRQQDKLKIGLSQKLQRQPHKAKLKGGEEEEEEKFNNGELKEHAIASMFFSVALLHFRLRSQDYKTFSKAS